MSKQIDDLKEQYRAKKTDRRSFLRSVVALGVSTSAAYTLLDALNASTAEAQTFTTFAVGEEDGGFGNQPTTLAIGEEDGSGGGSGGGGRLTTYAIGEEDNTGGGSGGGTVTTKAIGEEGGSGGGTVTTFAIGEEGGSVRPPRKPTSFLFGEDGNGFKLFGRRFSSNSNDRD